MSIPGVARGPAALYAVAALARSHDDDAPMTLDTYLSFSGNCRDACDFYREAQRLTAGRTV